MYVLMETTNLLLFLSSSEAAVALDPGIRRAPPRAVAALSPRTDLILTKLSLHRLTPADAALFLLLQRRVAPAPRVSILALARSLRSRIAMILSQGISASAIPLVLLPSPPSFRTAFLITKGKRHPQGKTLVPRRLPKSLVPAIYTRTRLRPPRRQVGRMKRSYTTRLKLENVTPPQAKFIVVWVTPLVFSIKRIPLALCAISVIPIRSPSGVLQSSISPHMAPFSSILLWMTR